VDRRRGSASPSSPTRGERSTANNGQQETASVHPDLIAASGEVKLFPVFVVFAVLPAPLVGEGPGKAGDAEASDDPPESYMISPEKGGGER
jgi:hypothetical protein